MRTIAVLIIILLCQTCVFPADNSMLQINMKMLNNKRDSTNTRISAMKTLIKHKDAAFVLSLKNILMDRKEDVKLRAATAQMLAECDKEGVDALLAAAPTVLVDSYVPLKDKEERLKYDDKELPFITEYISIIGKTKNPDFIPILMTTPVWTKKTRHLVPLALGDIGKSGMVWLFTLSQDHDYKTRLNSLIGLSKLNDSVLLPAYIDTIKYDESENIRTEAIKIVGALGDKKAIPKLEEFKKTLTGENELEALNNAIKTLSGGK